MGKRGLFLLRVYFYKMQNPGIKDISQFFVAGISYRKTDAETRGKFAIDNQQYHFLLEKASLYRVDEMFVVSTCNRTEIYGFAETASQLVELICSETNGEKEIFLQSSYIKNGIEAAEHLFNVSGGLDSQILGDYEIVGQIKTAAKFAKEKGLIAVFTERLLNAALQSSKAIKNQTALSGGTVSVSFAAAQYIRENFKSVSNKKILLLGTGKIGRNTCKNLVDYLGTTNITLINRTEEKAEELAKELNLKHASIERLSEHIAAADIIIVATNSDEPTILRTHLEGKGEKLIIDLSIPYNVEESAKNLSNITLVNVDELSKLKDETLVKRKAEVPKAKAIIAEHIEDFIDWYEMRKNVPVLKAVKSKLKEIHSCPAYFRLYPETQSVKRENPDQKIQKVINGLASKMRQQNQRGCHYIEAINEFIATGTD